MGKYGLDIYELEQEFQRNLEELFELALSAPEKRQRAVVYATFYLIEVVKRWRTPGMTVQKIREGSERALDRQIRKWGSEELKNLLEEQRYEEETKEEVKAESSESADTRATETVRAPANSPADGLQEPPGLGNVRPSGASETDSQEGDQPSRSEECMPETPEPKPDRKDEKEQQDMKPKICARCHGPMAPDMEDPLPRSSDLCPACGWNPEDLRKPRDRLKRPRKPQTGPQPPKAGKSFSDD